MKLINVCQLTWMISIIIDVLQTSSYETFDDTSKSFVLSNQETNYDPQVRLRHPTLYPTQPSSPTISTTNIPTLYPTRRPTPRPSDIPTSTSTSTHTPTCGPITTFTPSSVSSSTRGSSKYNPYPTTFPSNVMITPTTVHSSHATKTTGGSDHNHGSKSETNINATTELDILIGVFAILIIITICCLVGCYCFYRERKKRLKMQELHAGLRSPNDHEDDAHNIAIDNICKKNIENNNIDDNIDDNNDNAGQQYSIPSYSEGVPRQNNVQHVMFNENINQPAYRPVEMKALICHKVNNNKHLQRPSYRDSNLNANKPDQAEGNVIVTN